MPGFELIGNEEKAAVQSIFDEGGVLFAHGFDKMRKHFHVREFEASCQEYFGSKKCLAVSSGTAAIKIALKSVGVKPGDEVITQAFNFVATIEAILDCGAIPVLTNIDTSLNMDADELENLISEKTSAIIPVHMLGQSANILEIINIAKEHNIPVVEDNCEAIGAKFKGSYLGTVGDVGVFSFDQGKMIATGEGGMILTNSNRIFKYASEYHDHGHENNPKLPRGRDSKSIFGFNYRMTEMQAAVGKVQLSKLEYMLNENFKRYNKLESHIKDTFNLRETISDTTSSFDTLIIKEENENKRNEIIELLTSKGFGTKNLPDAMEWHCAFYWDHMLSPVQIKDVEKTKVQLEECIAIPIWLRKKVSDYDMLGKLLKEI